MKPKDKPTFQEALARLRDLSSFENDITDLPCLAAVAERVEAISQEMAPMRELAHALQNGITAIGQVLEDHNKKIQAFHNWAKVIQAALDEAEKEGNVG